MIKLERTAVRWSARALAWMTSMFFWCPGIRCL